MAAKILLKDQLFNPETVGQLAREYQSAVPGFDGVQFAQDALGGFAARELLQRLEWLADCVQAQLAPDFPTMADQLQAAMPAPLDPNLQDDDFGQFIHGVPGILAVRHGLGQHRERALDLIHAATQRFSMEFYIRPFLNQWPDQTLARLDIWAGDDNYHVRRLVSEGTRPKLPWAKALSLKPEQVLPFLDWLHGDPTRYVTRSVANHLNDLAKTDPDLVLDRLAAWGQQGIQTPKELGWMQRHALRTLIKQGNRGAMTALGYPTDLRVSATIHLAQDTVRIGQTLTFMARIMTDLAAPVLVDYVLWFTKADGALAPKVFKLKAGQTTPGEAFEVHKSHRLKGDATTFRLYPGPARIGLQVNGKVVAQADLTLIQ